MSNHIKLCDIRDFVVSSKPTVNLTEDDTYDMIETCGLIIHDYVHMDPLKFATPSFHDDLKNECFELLTQQLTNIHIENMNEVLSKIVERAHTIYFSKILPLRSFPYTFIRKLPNIEATKKKIETLHLLYGDRLKKTTTILFTTLILYRRHENEKTDTARPATGSNHLNPTPA